MAKGPTTKRRRQRTAMVAVARRLDRRALLRGTALQAVFGLAFVVPAALNPAAAQPAPNARPQGGQVVAGTAAIATTPNTTAITQSSNRAAIDWRSFNVGSQQSVTFQQPGTSSVTLNRVTGGDPSAIAGRISANGQIILTNPSGVTFYNGAQVNAQSVIVSAPGITNQNFMAGRMVFDQPASPNARIDNRGTITVRQAGLAALVAPSVANSGVINARMGNVVLAGAAAHTLDMYGDGLVSIDVTKKVVQAPLGLDGKPVTALVTNTGTIRADGGTVQLTAQAADGVVQDLVRAGGTIRANTANGRAGQIEIVGTGGSVVIEGRVAADGRTPGSTGGTVVAAGSTSTVIAPTARVSADGHSGGGTVAVGTTLARARGTGPAPAGTSARTVVAAGARVSADAKVAGDGGRVTVLSTQTTSMDGAISARGGRVSGNGGTIELSGETGFRLTGSADTSAPHGALGTVVLDPRDLTITTSTPDGATNITPTNGVDPNIAAGTGGTTTDAYVTPQQLLALTGNVHLQTTRDLVVASSVSVNGGSTFWLEAGRNLTVNSDVSINNPAAPNVTIKLSAGSSAIAGYDPAGALTISGTVIASNLVLSAGTGGMAFNDSQNVRALISSTTGPISLNTTGTVRQNSGTVSTPLLTGTVGSLVLDNGGNAISGINALTATAGPVTIFSGVPLTIGSTVPGGTNGIVASTGQRVLVLADTLTLRSPAAGTPAISAPGGSVGLSPFTLTRNIEINGSPTINGGVTTYTPAQLGLVQTSSLQLGISTTQGNYTGTITFGVNGIGNDLIANGNFDTIYLATFGTVNQGAGGLTAKALTGNPGTVSLGNANNAIGSLQNLNLTGGDLQVQTSGNLVLSGTVSTPGNSTITAGGNVTVAGGGILTSQNLNLSATGDLLMSGQISGTQSVSVRATNNLTVAPGATITNTGTTVYVLAGNNLDTGAGSTIRSGQDVTVAAGSFSVGGANDAAALTLRGNIIAPGIASLYAGTGGISFLGGTTQGTTAIVLATSGDVTQTAGSLVTNDIFTDDFYQFYGGVRSLSLPSRTNAIKGLASTGQGGVSVTGATGDLTVVTSTSLSVGSQTNNNVSLKSGRTATLVTDFLTVNSVGDAKTIDVSGGTLILSPFTAGGSIVLGSGSDKPGTGLSLSATEIGRISASTLQLGLLGTGSVPTVGNITIGTDPASNIDLGSSGITALHILATGNVTQGGALGVGTLYGQAGSLDMSFGNASVSNFINELAGFTTTTGNLALHTSSGLTVSAAVTANGGAGTVTLSSEDFVDVATGRSMVLAANVTGSTVSLNSITNGPSSVSGGIFQSGGIVTATTLQATGGFATLEANNQVANLGTSTIDQYLSLTTLSPLVITGTVQAASTTLDTRGLTQLSTSSLQTSLLNGSASADTVLNSRLNQVSGILNYTQTAGDFTLVTASPTLSFGGGYGEITGTTGSLTFIADRVAVFTDPTALSGTVTFAPYTPSRRMEIIGSTTADFNSLSLNSAFLSNVHAKRLALGNADSTGAINIGNAGETIDLTGVASTLQLRTTGAVTQGITAPSVSGANGTLALLVSNVTGSAGSIVLDATANRISSVGAADGIANEVNGLSASAGDLTVRSSLSLSAVNTVSAAGGTLTLSSAGALTAAGALSGGNITLESRGGTLAQTGGSIATSGTLTLTAPGQAITQAGTITAGTLAGSASRATLTYAVSVSRLGAFAADGDFTLSNTGPLTVAGPFTAGSATLGTTGALTFAGTTTVSTTLALSAGGAVTGTTVTAGTLTGSAASVNLTGDNGIATLGGFTTAGGFTLVNRPTLTVAGPLSAANATLSVTAGNIVLSGTVTVPGGALGLNASGTITQTGGTITAASLGGNSGGDVSLTATGNDIGALTGFNAQTGAFSLKDGRSLLVTGGLSAGSAALNVTGDLGFSGSAAGISTPNGTAMLNATGTITEGAGSIQAATLTGGANSADFSTGSNNQIYTLGAFTTQGRFALTDSVALLTVTGPVLGTDITLAASGSGALALNGPVTASGTLNLQFGGAITEGTGGSIGAATLTGSAASASLGGANAVATLGSFTTTGTFALTDGQTLTVAGPLSATSANLAVTAGDLLLTGTVSVPGGSLALSANGSISQSTGALVAGTLSGSAGGSTSLVSRGNAVATLGAFTSGADFALVDSRGLTVGGAVSAGQGRTLSLQSDSITFNRAGSLTATGGTVALAEYTAGAGLTLGGPGSFVAGNAPITATTLRVGNAASGPITITGAFDLSNVSVLDLQSAGAVSETGNGAVRVATLQGRAASFALGGTNQVATLGNLVATAGDTALNTTADLAINGAVSGRTVTLAVGGALSEGTGGSIAATTLTGSAASANLGGANAVATLGAFTTTGAFSLNDTQALTVAGTLSATGASLSVAGNLVINGAVSTPGGTTSLVATGAITEGANGSVTAAALTGSADSAILTGGNSVATLAGFITRGDFNLTDTRGLVVTAPVDPNTVTLTINGDLGLNSTVTGTTVVLNVTGAITEGTGGGIVASTLTGSGTSVSLGGANQVATLGAFTSGGLFALNDGQTLTVAGPLSATSANLAVTAGDLLLAGTVSVPGGNLALSATGSITQSTGTLVAGTLSGSAGGGTSLVSRGNAVATLGAFTSGADFALVDSQALAINAPVSAGSSANPGRTLSLQSDSITFNRAGSLTATGGTVALAEYTVGAGLTLGGPGSFVAGNAPITATTLRIGSAASGPIIITGAFDLSNVSVLDLQSAGAVSETGNGAVRVATLQGRAASFALGGANQVATLGNLVATAGDTALNTTTDLAISGAVSGNNVSLTANGALALYGSVAAPNGTATLVATGGAITEGLNGSLTAATLTGSAASTSLTGSNAVGTLGAFTTSGSFALTDSQNLIVAGPLSASNASLIVTAGNLAVTGTVSTPGGTTTLVATAGSITEVGGSVIAGTLTGSSASATLDGSGNAVGTLGAFATGAGPFSFTDGISLLVNGPVSGRAVTLSSTNGDLTLAGAVSTGTLTLRATGVINQTGGSISAVSLTGSAASVSLGSTGNQVSILGPFTATSGSFAFTDGQTLTVGGPLVANSASLSVGGDLMLVGLVSTPGGLGLSVSGSITQTGGTLVAGTLSGSAGGGTSLVSRGNAVATLGAFTSGADFALVDSQALAINAPVSAGSAANPGRTLSLQSDSITFNRAGSLTATGGTVALAEYTAGAGLTLGGPGSFVAGNAPITATTLRVGSAASGPITITGAFDLSNVSVLDLQSAGAVSETGNGAIRVATLQGRAASFALGGTNQVATLGNLVATAGDVALNTTTDLAINGAVSGRTVTLTPGGALTEGAAGSIAATTLTGSAASANLGGANAVATLGAFTTTGAFSLNDTQALTVGGTVSVGTLGLTINGDLALNAVVATGAGGTASLNVAGNVTEGTAGQLIAGTLTGGALSLTMGNGNLVTTLGNFGTGAGFTFFANGSLSVAGTVSSLGAVAISSAGPLSINGTVTGPGISLEARSGGIGVSGTVSTDGALRLLAAGDVVQTGGGIVANVLSGTASSFNLGQNGAAVIAGLRDLFASSGITILDQSSLNVAGTVSAPVLSLTSTGTMVLDRTALGFSSALLAVRAGADGTGGIQQTGTTTVSALASGAALTFALPAQRGTLSLGNFQAPDVNVTLNLGAGTATGTMAARSLTVSGNAGSATLFGSVAGRTDGTAALISSKLPAIDASYTFNGCIIGAASCTPVTNIFEFNRVAATIFEPSDAIASILRPDILTLDVLDLSVTRDRDDPTLLLPNISDRDY